MHTRLGVLELITAWTPAHSEACTLTYEVSVDDEALRRLVSERAPEVSEPERWIQTHDHDAMRELQTRLEAGEHWAIIGRPSARGVPISRSRAGT